MADAVVLVPSRGRPGNVARLIEYCAKTCRADTIVHFGFDDDDPALTGNLKAADGCLTSVEPRMGLGGWTNHLAALHPDAAWLCSMGDDMTPLTDGWDERLIDAQHDMGGGFCYPDDQRRADIPECVMVDSRVVAALGWLCEPSLHHWYVDNVWRDLGAAVRRLRYCPEVKIPHLHPNVPGGDRPDQTYWDAAPKIGADLAAYQKWRMKRMHRDIATVAGCLA
jgi:hypothetical protein